jgi:glutamyl-tRNA reductase
MESAVVKDMKTLPLYHPHVVLTGVSFRTLDVDGRERLVRQAQDPQKIARSIVEQGLASEAAVISTCNRFEIVSVVGDESHSDRALLRGDEPGGGIRRFFESLVDLSAKNSLYQFVDSSAVRHLYRVSSSLDSMVLGEAQILGQVKDAYKKAVEEGVVGTHLHHLFQSAFHVAKRVRAHTEISQHGVSVSYVAVRLAQQIFENLQDTRVLIIGSGEMAELAALHLCSHGCRHIVVANRTVERAAELAERFGGAAVSLSDVEEMLEQVDIVIGSIRIDHSILTKSSVRKRAGDKPLFLIDLGVPRNFSSDLAELDSVYLYNIDDLAGIAEQNKALREAAAREAEVVIDYGLLQFEKWRVKIAAQPELVSLRGRVQGICDEEITRVLGSALEADRDVLLDQLSRAITQKLSHEITELLGRKKSSAPEDGDGVPFILVPKKEE